MADQPSKEEIEDFEKIQILMKKYFEWDANPGDADVLNELTAYYRVILQEFHILGAETAAPASVPTGRQILKISIFPKNVPK